MELLSPMAVMLEGLGFNLCVEPFLNVCVLNLLQRVRDGVCQRWSEFGQRCHTRFRQRKTERVERSWKEDSGLQLGAKVARAIWQLSKRLSSVTEELVAS